MQNPSRTALHDPGNYPLSISDHVISKAISISVLSCSAKEKLFFLSQSKVPTKHKYTLLVGYVKEYFGISHKYLDGDIA